ncbi:MAG: TVP38/TMEM64 family protein [Clostridia bacterium]|nr:TVP38/TMEM64 family protein [Clostridia bacterium]
MKKFKKRTKEEKRSLVLKIISIACFSVALFLVFLTYLVTLPHIQLRIAEIQDWFNRIEMFIGSLNKLWAFFAVIAFFIIKSVIPFVPLSVLFISSGLVFPAPLAAAINVLGFAMLVSAKYLWGKKLGGGSAHKVLVKSETVYDFMDLGGKGNWWMLVILRFVPFIPINTVSRIYGATAMDYWRFCLFSVLGFLPRIITWSIIGVNITDPFSVKFMAPIIILLIISGSSVLVLRTMLNYIDKNKKKES